MDEQKLPNALAESLAAFIDSVVDEEFEAHYNPQVETIDAFRERHVKKICGGLEAYLQQIEEGFDDILSAPSFSSDEVKQIRDGLKRVRANSQEFIEEFADLSISPGAVLSLPDAFYEKGFRVAQEAFDREEYAKATKIFLTLSQLDPTDFHFTLGLGCCLMATEDFGNAITTLMLSAQWAGDDAHIPLSLIVDTLISMSEFEKAKTVAESLQKEAKNEKSEAFLRAKEQLEIIAELQQVKES